MNFSQFLRRTLRGLSLLTLICFLTSTPGLPPALAAAEGASSFSRGNFPADLHTVKVPKAFGKIESIWRGSDPRSVILLQDAHAVPAAQRSLQNLIDHFEKTYGLGLIALEGAAGELDPRIFKSFPDPKALRKVFENYYESGELTGGNAAALFNETEASYHGIEDWPLYETGLRFYQEALKKEPAVEKGLNRWKKGLDRRKRETYSKELLEVDQALERFFENQEDLLSLLNKLSLLKARAAFGELALILEAGEGDPKREAAIENEVKKLAEKIKGFLKPRMTSPKGREELKRFNEKLQAYQTSSLSAEGFALFLEDLAQKENLPLPLSPRLRRLIQHQIRLGQIEGTRLYRDLLEYVEAVKGSLMKTPEERALNQESDQYQLLSRLARLELTFEDWDSLSRHSDEKNLLRFFSPHLAFYQNSELRDQAFFKHLTQLMKETQSEQALLVAGGFHTEGLTRQFQEAGISYLLIRPAIPSVPKESVYRAQMQGEVSWKGYFKVEKGRVNLYQAFVRATRDRLLEGAVPFADSTFNSRLGPRPWPGLLSRSTRPGFQAPGEWPSEARSLDFEPSTRSSLLKAWRDQIIRDLAQENRIESAGRYTSFIDEAMMGPIPPASQDSLLHEWLQNADRFVKGLGHLRSRGQLTQPNVLKLLRASNTQTLAGSIFARGTWAHPVTVGLDTGRYSGHKGPAAFDEAQNDTSPRRSEVRNGGKDRLLGHRQDKNSRRLGISKNELDKVAARVMAFARMYEDAGDVSLKKTDEQVEKRLLKDPRLKFVATGGEKIIFRYAARSGRDYALIVALNKKNDRALRAEIYLLRILNPHGERSDLPYVLQTAIRKRRIVVVERFFPEGFNFWNTDFSAWPHLKKAELALSLTGTMAYAASHGILHRDLKPGNIWIPQVGPPMVADFSQAILLPPPKGNRIFRDPKRIRGTVVTPGVFTYLGPGERDYFASDRRKDLFAFGRILEFLFGLLDKRTINIGAVFWHFPGRLPKLVSQRYINEYLRDARKKLGKPIYELLRKLRRSDPRRIPKSYSWDDVAAKLRQAVKLEQGEQGTVPRGDRSRLRTPSRAEVRSDSPVGDSRGISLEISDDPDIRAVWERQTEFNLGLFDYVAHLAILTQLYGSVANFPAEALEKLISRFNFYDEDAENDPAEDAVQTILGYYLTILSYSLYSFRSFSLNVSEFLPELLANFLVLVSLQRAQKSLENSKDREIVSAAVKKEQEALPAGKDSREFLLDKALGSFLLDEPLELSLPIGGKTQLRSYFRGTLKLFFIDNAEEEKGVPRFLSRWFDDPLLRWNFLDGLSLLVRALGHKTVFFHYLNPSRFFGGSGADTKYRFAPGYEDLLKEEFLKDPTTYLEMEGETKAAEWFHIPLMPLLTWFARSLYHGSIGPVLPGGDEEKIRIMKLKNDEKVFVKRLNVLRSRFPEEEILLAERAHQALQKRNRRYRAQEFIGIVFDAGRGYFHLLSKAVSNSRPVDPNDEQDRTAVAEIEEVLSREGIADPKGPVRHKDILVTESDGERDYTVIDFESMPYRGRVERLIASIARSEARIERPVPPEWEMIHEGKARFLLQSNLIDCWKQRAGMTAGIHLSWKKESAEIPERLRQDMRRQIEKEFSGRKYPEALRANFEQELLVANLGWIIHELLKNAFDAVARKKSEEEIVFRVYRDPRGRLIIIEVSDNGIGITEITGKGWKFRVTSPHPEKIDSSIKVLGGQGKGALGSKLAAELHGGRFEILQAPNTPFQTTIRLTFPEDEIEAVPLEFGEMGWEPRDGFSRAEVRNDLRGAGGANPVMGTALVLAVALIQHGGPLGIPDDGMRIDLNKEKLLSHPNLAEGSRRELEKSISQIVNLIDQYFNLIVGWAVQLDQNPHKFETEKGVANLTTDYAHWLHETGESFIKMKQLLDSLPPLTGEAKQFAAYLGRLAVRYPVYFEALLNFLEESERKDEIRLQEWLPHREWLTKANPSLYGQMRQGKRSGVRINVAAGVGPLHLSEALLHLILERLISNGFHASKTRRRAGRKGIVYLEARPGEKESKVELMIENQGWLKPEQLRKDSGGIPSIFHLQRPRRSWAGGIGLPFINLAVRMMGGAIEARNVFKKIRFGKQGFVQFKVSFPARAEVRPPLRHGGLPSAPSKQVDAETSPPTHLWRTEVRGLAFNSKTDNEGVEWAIEAEIQRVFSPPKNTNAEWLADWQEKDIVFDGSGVFDSKLVFERGKETIRLIGVNKGDTVFDGGAGEGGFSLVLALLGAWVTAVEKKSENITVLEKRYEELKDFIDRAGGRFELIKGEFPSPQVLQKLAGRKFRHIIATDLVTPNPLTERLSPKAPPTSDPQKVLKILSALAQTKSHENGKIIFSIPDFVVMWSKARRKDVYTDQVPYLIPFIAEVVKQSRVYPSSSVFVSVPYSHGIKRGVLYNVVPIPQDPQSEKGDSPLWGDSQISSRAEVRVEVKARRQQAMEQLSQIVGAARGRPGDHYEVVEIGGKHLKTLKGERHKGGLILALPEIEHWIKRHSDYLNASQSGTAGPLAPSRAEVRSSHWDSEGPTSLPILFALIKEGDTAGEVKEALKQFPSNDHPTDRRAEVRKGVKPASLESVAAALAPGALDELLQNRGGAVNPKEAAGEAVKFVERIPDLGRFAEILRREVARSYRELQEGNAKGRVPFAALADLDQSTLDLARAALYETTRDFGPEAVSLGVHISKENPLALKVPVQTLLKVIGQEGMPVREVFFNSNAPPEVSQRIWQGLEAFPRQIQNFTESVELMTQQAGVVFMMLGENPGISMNGIFFPVDLDLTGVNDPRVQDAALESLIVASLHLTRLLGRADAELLKKQPELLRGELVRQLNSGGVNFGAIVQSNSRGFTVQGAVLQQLLIQLETAQAAGRSA